jgi:CDP-2,3-bis-(O-geranylgeranyl)-sn-glycerol synthase
VEKIIVEFLVFFWKCAYLMLPAGLSNMVPVFFRRINFLNYRVDFGKSWRGRPLFGTNKTLRGLFFGTLSSILLVGLQTLLYLNYGYFRSISFIDYSQHSFILIGFLLGFGALFGDLVESFFKRRFRIKPGKRWFPWDQLDFLIGSLIFLSFTYIPSWQALVLIIIAGPILHVTFKHLGYYLRINKEKW